MKVKQSQGYTAFLMRLKEDIKYLCGKHFTRALITCLW